MQTMFEKLDRLRAMVAKGQQTWDLSPKDVEAIQMAVDVFELLAESDDIMPENIVTSLRRLCDNCLRAPQNRHANAPLGQEPCCESCHVRWRAADEIEYLRDKLEEFKNELAREWQQDD